MYSFHCFRHYFSSSPLLDSFLIDDIIYSITIEYHIHSFHQYHLLGIAQAAHRCSASESATGEVEPNRLPEQFGAIAPLDRAHLIDLPGHVVRHSDSETLIGELGHFLILSMESMIIDALDALGIIYSAEIF